MQVWCIAFVTDWDKLSINCNLYLTILTVLYGCSNAARRTIKGYEAMNMICKGQVEEVEKGNVMGQISFIHQIFGVAA